jgi:LEA14-like dessication related protein
MHPSRALSPAILAPLCFLLAGCTFSAALAGKFQDPVIRVEGSKVRALSPSTADVAFELSISNPNPYRLQAGKLSYRLSVEGETLAEGTAGVRTSLPAQGMATVELAFQVPFDALARLSPRGYMVGEIPCELEVHLSVGSLFFTRPVRAIHASVLRLNLPLGLARAGAFAFKNRDWQT